MTDDRLVTGARKEADSAEASPRPQYLAEFIGQEQARSNLGVFIQAAKKRGHHQAKAQNAAAVQPERPAHRVWIRIRGSSCHEFLRATASPLVRLPAS